MNLESLSNGEPRLLFEVSLEPLQGTRFQPTGFPDLGAAEYHLSDGTRMLLVESAQSMANHLESACWDEPNDDWVEPLRGLPCVRSVLPDGTTTNSVLEAHRLNSPYIVNSEGFAAIRDAIGFESNKPFDRRRLARALLRFDPNSLVHGIFLEKVGGVVRLPRAVSAFVEARDVEIAPHGGVKFDRIQPASGADSTPYGKAAEGYGNVPYHRDDYTAGSVRAYFNLDLALLRGYGLGRSAEQMLTAFSLFKVQRFLRDGLRLRTACDFEAGETIVRRPEGFSLPPLAELAEALPALIEGASESFGEPRTLTVRFDPKKKK